MTGALFRRIFTGLALAGIVAVHAVSVLAGESPRRGGRLVFINGAGEPRHLNPAIDSGTTTAVPGTQIFASPLRYDDQWQPQPWLARDWRFSPDGLSLTLYLEPDAVFHDGQPVTSADVAFSIGVIRQYHPFQTMFEPVTAVETPDSHTAVIRLAHPHPALLLCLSPALCPILPAHVYGDGQDIRSHPANRAPVGCGPFRFVSWREGEGIVLERFDRYFRTGLPYLDRIIIKNEPRSEAQVIEMERRQAHVLSPIADFDILSRIQSLDYLQAIPRGFEGIGPLVWLAFNLGKPPLDDRRVRQAIAYLVDPGFIVGYLHRGIGVRATGPIAPSSPFYEPEVNLYAPNPKLAARLLDEAGHPLVSGRRFRLNLDYIPVLPEQHQKVALYLKHRLAQAGIEVTIRDSPSFKDWAEFIRNRDFDMTLDSVYNWGDPVIGIHRTYLSSNIRPGVLWSNTQQYRNAEVDRLLDLAGQEREPSRRREYYGRFQKIVVEDAPVVYLNVLPYHTVLDRNLGNPPISIWGPHSPLDEMYWKIPPPEALVPVPDPLASSGESPEILGPKVIAVLAALPQDRALALLREPHRGFLGQDESGLHVIGFTRRGVVFLDTSEQTRPGMDIGGLRELDGEFILPRFIAAADGGGFALPSRSWPHPETQKTGEMTAWCGSSGRNDVVCLLRWKAPAPGGNTP